MQNLLIGESQGWVTNGKWLASKASEDIALFIQTVLCRKNSTVEGLLCSPDCMAKRTLSEASAGRAQSPPGLSKAAWFSCLAVIVCTFFPSKYAHAKYMKVREYSADNEQTIRVSELHAASVIENTSIHAKKADLRRVLPYTMRPACIQNDYLHTRPILSRQSSCQGWPNSLSQPVDFMSY